MWSLSSCICAVGRSSAFFKDISAAGVSKAKRWLFFCHSYCPSWFSAFLSESKCENFTVCTNQKSSHQTVSISLLAQRNYRLKESFAFQNLIQDFQIYQASLNKSLLLKKKMEKCSAGGGNQTFQWEHLSLIDSITWSTNLEIDTPICLEWQINLFQVSEEEWNEFQKLHTHETNVKIPLLIFTSSEMNASFCFSLRDLLLQY